jgi:predicted nucleic acid-binding protein
VRSSIGVELVDTSVWAQKQHASIRDWFNAALIDGELVICDMVALEILQGAGSPALFAQIAALIDGMGSLPMGAAEWSRANEVYRLIEERLGTSFRRSVKLPDLLIAACAERHAVTIVHYDHDYDVIARVTGQPTRWAAERGSL